MKDSKNVMDMKKNAVHGARSSSFETKDSGYKLYHLLFMAIIGLMLGAYLQIHVLKERDLLAEAA